MEVNEARYKNYVYDLDGSVVQISGDPEPLLLFMWRRINRKTKITMDATEKKMFDERLLKWEYLPSYQRAEYNGIVYFIERSYFGKYQLLIKIGGKQNHITGGQTVGKIKRIAEKDLKKRLDSQI